MNTHPLELLIMQYLAEKDITKDTSESYTTLLKQYTVYLKKHQILYAKTSDVINYREFIRNQGHSTGWIYNHMSALKGLYQYLSFNQKRLDLPVEYAYDITEPLKNERLKNPISKPILTVNQAKQLILSTKNNRKYIWHYRDHAILYMMITAGMRSIEIRRARKKDLRVIDNQLILYVQGKGRMSADAFVKISKGVEEGINDYLNKRKDKNPYLFISHSKHSDVPYLSRTFFNRMFKRVLKDSGLEDILITPHALRHTAATFNLQRGGSLEQTRQFMRHKDMSTTLIYAHHIKPMKDDSEHLLEHYILKEDSFSYKNEVKTFKVHHLEGLSAHYLLEKNIAKTTIKSYKIAFKHYITYLKENHIDCAKTSDVIRYRESRRALGHSSYYIYIQISALKGLYRYLRLNQKRLDLPDAYAYDVMALIRNERIKHHIQKPILTIEQAKKMIFYTKNNRKYIWNYRDHVIIYLMVTTGMRSIEIVRAKRNDYQIVGEKQLLYIPKKGIRHDDAFVKISNGVNEAIHDYLNKRKDDSPYLFISHKKVSNEGYLSRVFFIDMFHRVLKECGLEGSGITPHCLRHTAAAMNLLRGGSIEQTRSLLRHVNIQSTLVYQDHIDRMKDDSESEIEKFILKEDDYEIYDDLYIDLSNHR